MTFGTTQRSGDDNGEASLHIDLDRLATAVRDHFLDREKVRAAHGMIIPLSPGATVTVLTDGNWVVTGGWVLSPSEWRRQAKADRRRQDGFRWWRWITG